MTSDDYPREIGYANRSLLLLRPRPAMINWVQGCDPESPVSDEEVARATEAILIPAFEVVADAWGWLHENADALFEVALGSWYGDRGLWPRRRDWATLQEWFDLEIVDVVWDVVDAPLTSDLDASWEEGGAVDEPLGGEPPRSGPLPGGFGDSGEWN
jgi:hypothetical protein